MAVTWLTVDDNAAFVSVATQLLEIEGIVVVDSASAASDAVPRAAETRSGVALVTWVSARRTRREVTGSCNAPLPDPCEAVDQESRVVAEHHFLQLVYRMPAKPPTGRVAPNADEAQTWLRRCEFARGVRREGLRAARRRRAIQIRRREGRICVHFRARQQRSPREHK
jgi:CheY-like chemotaxis protein